MEIVGVVIALILLGAIFYGLFVGSAGRGVGASLGRLVRTLRR